MLIPSSVMLIELFGRPLIVESRAVPEVLNPGSDVSESIALRLVSGRLMICVADIVVATEGVWVCTTRPLSPTTVTFSSIAPTDITTFTLAGYGRVQRDGAERDGLETLQRHGHAVAAAGERGDREGAVDGGDRDRSRRPCRCS